MTNSDVLMRMDQCVLGWQPNADGRAIFLRCYRMMTANMLQALEQGSFKNAAWTDHLLHHFADYYFRAVDAYDLQQPELPAVWRYAFDAANQPNLAPIQQLLLGVNAHISFDLVLTLHDLLRGDWDGLGEPERGVYFSDYSYVNTIIRQTIDDVQDQILEPAQPSMRLVDDLMGRVDEWLLGHMITHWRDKVWQNAERLLAARSGKDKNQVVQAVESRAIERADAIAGKDWPLGIRKIL